MQLSDFQASSNLVSLFLARADELGDKPMLWAKRDGEWQSTSWKEAARQVCTIAQGLRKLGLKPGERVMLVSENRPEWCLADLAIMAAGCVTVPTYTTNTTRDHIHILENSGARAAIVSSSKLGQTVVPALAQTDFCEFLVSIEPIKHDQEGNFAWVSWDSLLEGDGGNAREAVDARIANIAREDLACIIYTSGTGGAPRGVRQHHGMLLHNIEGCAHIIVDDFGWDDEV
ncbi:MAG: AMP-binding protein, partial [Novosphingobium sp.]|nr:AMP-binding protein [Novosphingobium sp.]